MLVYALGSRKGSYGVMIGGHADGGQLVHRRVISHSNVKYY
jgi:hypothetical protein